MGRTNEPLSLEAALKIAGWPMSLTAPEKQPRVINTVAEFEQVLLLGQHIDTIHVLRNGIGLLGMEDALPSELLKAARTQPSTRAFLRSLDAELLAELRGRVYCTGSDGEEKELKTSADGVELDTLLDKGRALKAMEEAGVGAGSVSGLGASAGGDGRADGGWQEERQREREQERELEGEEGAEGIEAENLVYIAEIRRAHKYRHPLDGLWAKTVLASDVKDWIGRERAEALPYWDRYDEGVFVGGRFAGSPLHVDQVVWSNVGKNFCGCKLLAVWPYGERSRALFDRHNYKLFTPPLPPRESAALEEACSVALLSPGDVVLFSGGNAHMALSVSDALSVTAYESFINLELRNLAAFLDSGTHRGLFRPRALSQGVPPVTLRQYRQCRARQPMLEDIKLDVADAIGKWREGTSCAHAGPASEQMSDLLLDLEDGVVADKQLQAHAPAAIELLRGDPVIRDALQGSVELPSKICDDGDAVGKLSAV